MADQRAVKDRAKRHDLICAGGQCQDERAQILAREGARQQVEHRRQFGVGPDGDAHARFCHLAPAVLARHICPMIPPRFPVTPDQIDRVVATFYAAVRRHEVLGPVFARHVADWPAHEARIAAFWRNAIMYERGYDGNPMRVHMQAGDVRPEHFDDWLMLFDATLIRVLPRETARAWSALAHRIGAGLRMGVRDLREPGGPPILD